MVEGENESVINLGVMEIVNMQYHVSNYLLLFIQDMYILCRSPYSISINASLGIVATCFILFAAAEQTSWVLRPLEGYHYVLEP